MKIGRTCAAGVPAEVTRMAVDRWRALPRCGTAALIPLVFLSVTVMGCAYRRVGRYHRAILTPAVSGSAPVIQDDHRLAISPQRVRLTREYFAKHHRDLAAILPVEDHPASIRFEPRLVVVHYTAIPTLARTLATFAPETLDPQRGIARQSALNVGIQFIVDRDGTIYRSYPETVMSRHVIGLNHVAIGIENVGDADLGAREKHGVEAPLTRAQLDANLFLIRYLAGKYPSIRYVIGHSEYRDLEDELHPAHHLFHEDVATYRTEKVDPGRRFLRQLRAALSRTK